MLRLLNFFDNLVIFLQISRTTNFSNQKLGLQYYTVGDAIQVTILPASVLSSEKPLTGKGTLTKAQESACGINCAFKVNTLPNSLRGHQCYVNHEVRSAALAAKKIYDKMITSPEDIEYINPKVNPIKYMVRLSIWGDLGRLNVAGQSALLKLCQNANQVRGYASDFDQLVEIEAWRNLIQASCQTKEHVDLARLLGFKMYLGTDEAYEYARSLDRVYRCPWTSKNRARANSEFQATIKYGCLNCALSCDGTYNIDGRHI